MCIDMTRMSGWYRRSGLFVEPIRVGDRVRYKNFHKEIVGQVVAIEGNQATLCVEGSKCRERVSLSHTTFEPDRKTIEQRAAVVHSAYLEALANDGL